MLKYIITLFFMILYGNMEAQNVGIGTVTPDEKLTVVGNVNIGGTGDNYLKVRHIRGKENNSTNIGNLYLNYNTDRDVYIGYGGSNLSSLLVSKNLFVDGVGGLYVRDGWIRVYGNKGLVFHDHGGGIYMNDSDWIRISGGKSFYHASGIMRTTGILQVGVNGNRLLVNTNGNVGINTTTPDYKLDVNGTIRSKQVIVEGNWSDYVFYPEYQLPTLSEEEQFIAKHGHLQGFESEEAMAGQIQLGDVTNRQQAKIEEMMLHLIQIKKENQLLLLENQKQQKSIDKLLKLQQKNERNH